MSLTSWTLFLVAAASAAAYALYVYRRREPVGRHRTLLAVLRAAALVLLLFLLFDPALPAAGRRSVRTVIALDRSLSMRLPQTADDSTSRWTAAVAQARDAAGGAPMLAFGDDVRSIRADSLGAIAPDAGASRLLPAVRAAAEAGAQRMTVFTDGGIEDAAEVARWLPRLGIALDYQRVGDGRPAARALLEVDAPAWAEAGTPIPVRVTVGPGENPVAITASAAGAEPARAEVAAVAEGRLETVTLEVTPAAPSDGGLVRIDVALEGVEEARRSAYVFVGEEPTGVALVSLRPDWEPRFLLPVLETALGVPVRGFLRAADGTWVRSGGSDVAGRRTDEAAVRRALAQADLIVLHGAGGTAPEWIRQQAAAARRIIVFPQDAGAPVPLEIAPPVTDEFYVTGDVPASPVAAVLAGLALETLPPLTELRPADIPPGAWAPLLASRGRRAAPQPVLLAGDQNGRRWAVALGSGYWRWAFRDEPSRTAYARMWGAVAGWLLREEGAIATAAVRPAERSIMRGAAIAWLAPGISADSVRIRFTGSAGDTSAATARRSSADTLRSAAPAPGHYTYDAVAFAGDSAIAQAAGPLTIDPYSPELAHAAVDLQALQAEAAPLGPRTERGPMRPLRASGLPWLLLVLLLLSEWTLRRRWGLR